MQSSVVVACLVNKRDRKDHAGVEVASFRLSRLVVACSYGASLGLFVLPRADRSPWWSSSVWHQFLGVGFGWRLTCHNGSRHRYEVRPQQADTALICHNRPPRNDHSQCRLLLCRRSHFRRLALDILCHSPYSYLHRFGRPRHREISTATHGRSSVWYFINHTAGRTDRKSSRSRTSAVGTSGLRFIGNICRPEHHSSCVEATGKRHVDINRR